MSKLAVKYLDPETGEYKYATVVDVGDLTKLKTTVKSDLVSAINSIEITGELPADVQNQLDEINQNINDIQSGLLTEAQVVGINQKITEGISSLVIEVGELNTKINDDIVKAKNELLGDMDQKLENVENDYNSKIGVISGSLDGAKADIDSVELDLVNIGTKLQKAETNYTKVSSDIDTINGELSTKVESSDFNLMESKVSQNTTEIEQTKENISLLATKSSLDLTTDRVTKAESDIKINADGLSSRVTYTELNEQLDNASKYGDNILRGTRNWDNWKTNNIAKAYISNNTYRHCKMQVIENKQYYYETELDGLEIGKTYIASIYFKTKVESDSASVNINIGSESIPLDNLVEDTLILNGWKRVSANFVASDVKTKVSFRFSFLDTNNIGYLVASKIETGIKPSEWKPHFDDDNESIIKNEALIKQNSDSVVSLVSSTEKLGEDIETANTQITQTAESLSLQAQKITDIEGEVSENKASTVIANNKIETKVSQTDVNKSISDIDLDTKNRIINSDLSRGFSNWNEINSGFTIKKISGVNYAHIDRSGLINASIASMASDKFPAKNGDKLVFSLDFMTESISSLDDKTIMTIELFDINDTRVFSKTFNVADFNVSIVDNVITRISSKYIVAREDVAKARVKIQLNKNGSVNFSKISLQKGDLKEKEWLLAPEDIQLLNVDLQTSITQNANNIELRANKTEVDTLSGRVLATESSLQIQDGKITALNTKTDGQTTQIGKLESSYSGLTSTISKIQTDVGRKADKTELSQLSQDLSGFKTTVSNTYLSKSDASGTYTDKVSVASQITQSATEVTSNVQSWTNNKLTAYSTTLQTDSSITNAVASKADKTQITQLSDNINLKVSKGDVVSQINIEAGKTLINSKKLVLNANTTEINGNAFIRGDMIVDGSINAEKIVANNLSAISSNIGDVSAGTIKLMDANWVINGQPKMYGIYQSKFGLVSSGPTFSRSAIVSNSKMGVANLNRGELRFSVNDYTEDLKNVQEAGMSVQNNAFIKFNSYENGKDVLLIGSSGDIVFSGDVEVTGNLTLPTKSWSGELGGGITLSLRKKGITVEYSIGGGISSNILTSSSLVKVSVPSEFCPKNRYSLVGHMAGNWNSFHIDITPSGVCQWYGPTTNTGTPRGTGTYPLD